MLPILTYRLVTRTVVRQMDECFIQCGDGRVLNAPKLMLENGYP